MSRIPGLGHQTQRLNPWIRKVVQPRTPASWPKTPRAIAQDIFSRGGHYSIGLLLQQEDATRLGELRATYSKHENVPYNYITLFDHFPPSMVMLYQQVLMRTSAMHSNFFLHLREPFKRLARDDKYAVGIYLYSFILMEIHRVMSAAFANVVPNKHKGLSKEFAVIMNNGASEVEADAIRRIIMADHRLEGLGHIQAAGFALSFWPSSSRKEEGIAKSKKVLYHFKDPSKRSKIPVEWGSAKVSKVATGKPSPKPRRSLKDLDLEIASSTRLSLSSELPAALLTTPSVAPLPPLPTNTSTPVHTLPVTLPASHFKTSGKDKHLTAMQRLQEAVNDEKPSKKAESSF